MEKKDHLYSGKAKTLYKTDNPDLLVLHFRDDTSAFDGVKTAQLKNKGKVNNHFNAFIMKKLTEAGIKNHFVSLIDDRESIVKNLDMIPVECVVRNISAGNLAKRLGIEEGLELKPTIFEMYYKSDALHDPMINEYHAETFGWASAQEISHMRAQSFKVNQILCDLFSKAGLLLVDFKLEFGRFHGEIILGDEFTPDGCRIWDAETSEKFDKDRFRRDLGNVIESYQMVAERLGIII